MPFEKERMFLIFLMMIILMEKTIPTKARPIQVNVELEQHCQLEIKYLDSKGLI
jgi:hypothetical protein